ncbi:MAG: HupE/UreJ family protein [Roseomonas sp.]|nr:HupE/UreJ family protein [Roseomonas sp.]MCA3285044.1 HupE/UreJ family protein [Roseomonas sp.]MCA3292088.1 HupE/UreJ family protein [Roseomonas sp.]MCA3296288.1 HupE/UreJ family protein [Roseomonas sp.]
MRRPSFALGLLALLPLPAAAHHPMDGAMPQTLWQGFASGIGHPVIGLDHLAFLLAAGVLAAALPRGEASRAIAGFLMAGMAGLALHMAGIGLGPIEALIAASVLLVGLALLVAKRVSAPALLAGFALAGLFHGHAFAEAVIGAEATPILAYLAGLAVIQGALMLGAMALAQQATRARWLRPAMGAVASLAGLGFLAVAVVA